MGFGDVRGDVAQGVGGAAAGARELEVPDLLGDAGDVGMDYGVEVVC